MRVYEGKELVFIGPVGTGFTGKMQDELLKRMKLLQTTRCPFAEEPDYNKPSRFRPNPPKAKVVWLKPELVAEVSYRAVGGDGGMRHPSFRGLREDKDPLDIKREEAVVIDEISKDVKTDGLEGKMLTRVDKERKTFLNQ